MPFANRIPVGFWIISPLPFLSSVCIALFLFKSRKTNHNAVFFQDHILSKISLLASLITSSFAPLLRLDKGEEIVVIRVIIKNQTRK